MRSGVKVGLVGGVFAVVACGVGYGGYNVYNGLTSGSSVGYAGPEESVPEIKTGPLSAEEISTAAKSFLAAWAAGDHASEAAQLTNNAVDAEPVIRGYHDTAHITDAVITPGTPVGATVPYTVKATVTFDDRTKSFTYDSKLTVVRGLTTGRPLVDWAPSVIHPKLTAGTELVTAESKAPAIKAVDRNGQELTGEKYPSLAPVLDELRKRYGAAAGGTSGVELMIQGGSENNADGTSGSSGAADGSGAAATTLLTLAEGKAGELRTTLDANVQAAAEKAVQKFSEASVAAVKPSSGDILAIANHRTDGWNAAVLGKQAPGSTMKIVTAAMLMEKGLAAPNRTAECPANVMYQGRTFVNLDGFSLNNQPFSQSFARSCNTAFIKLIDDTHDDTALPKEAKEVFGIGLDWQIGIPSSDGSVPEASGGEAAAQYIGQGTVQMSVLNMASITATARNGTFRQPVLVPRSLDDRTVATAQRSLPDSVRRGVSDMMRITATSGTAAQAMAGLGGDKGAKTGSAEVDNQSVSNSWFAGFDNDLAAAAVVQAGGHGGDAAGPVVAAVLAAG
ncbi:penicillin-binding transpeptidase domain-containing protein [Streptomyces sp. NPDC088725]|uniref:penicillin-binding transpeptidase domain-containing protein n=1 Tax=Streptomyces sp. NPDC088725 TaxID=3365873 RepID=UPI00381B957A